LGPNFGISFAKVLVGFGRSGTIDLNSALPSTCNLLLPVLKTPFHIEEGAKMAKILLIVCAGTIIFLTFAVCCMALIDQFRK
jgi:hypothetical protein